MADFRMTDEEKIQIREGLPNAWVILDWITLLTRETLDSLAGPGNTLAPALICLQDAARVACQVDYALYQACLHIVDNRKYGTSGDQINDELVAILMGKFYLEDATLRLYVAAEYMSAFLANFYNLDDKEQKFSTCLKELRNKGVTGRSTDLVAQLMVNANWVRAIKIRNDWVHNRPPLIATPGLGFKRRSGWNSSAIPGIQMMGIGTSGDVPDFSLDEFLEVVENATRAYEDVLSELTDLFFEKLKDLGITRDDQEKKIIHPPSLF